MKVTARPAVATDLVVIDELYGPAEAEQVELRETWGLADGLAEPRLETLHSILQNPQGLLVVGCIDDVVFGFGLSLIHISEPTRPMKESRIPESA